MHAVRFPFAVRVDRPYRYRVVTIHDDGQVHETAWMVRMEWLSLLDVTANSAEQIPTVTEEVR